MKTGSRILVIEDDSSIQDILKIILETNGFEEIYLASDGETGMEEAEKKNPDLILLDLTLPGIDGLEVCRRLRAQPQTSSIPIIMLTARSEESDVVAGLEVGAVDYILKPFSNRALVARIRAQIRRTSELTETQTAESEVIEQNGIKIILAERQVILDEKTIDLTFTEFEILLLFVKNAGRVWSRTEIALAVRDDEYAAFDRAIDVQIANLRKKLGPWRTNIETVRGVGYRLKRL